MSFGSFLKNVVIAAHYPHYFGKEWLHKSFDEPGVEIEQEGTDHAIRVLYGTNVVAPIKVLKHVSDGDGGADNEYLHLICIWGEGECNKINWLDVDDTRSTDQRFNEWLHVEHFLGADDQPHCAELSRMFSGWTSNHKLSGICYSYIRAKMDKNREVWQGEPRFKAEIEGRKVLDFRTGEWVFSANPALCQYDYLTNSRFGKGFYNTRVDLVTFTSAANQFDTAVEYEETIQVCNWNPDTKKIECDGWRTETRSIALMQCNVALDTSQKVLQNIKTLASGCRGLMPMTQGQIRLIPEDVGDPVFHFDRSNMSGKISSSSGEVSGRYNSVTVRFKNLAKDGAADEVTYPDANDDTALAALWLDEDGGKSLPYSRNFATINSKAEALQMARVVATRSRFGYTCSFVGTPETIVVESGDIVSVSCPIRGWDQRQFRVSDVVYRTDGTCKFSLREHNNAIYPWANISYQDALPVTNLGDPSTIDAPTNLSLARDPELEKTGRLTWLGPNDTFLAGYLITVVNTTEPDGHIDIETISTANNYVDIQRLPVGQYQIDVIAKTSIGRSDPASIGVEIELPLKPTHVDVTAGNFDMHLIPHADLGFTGMFEFAINTVDDSETMQIMGISRSFTYTNLSPDMRYYFWVRVVTINGSSDWLAISAKTNIVRDDVMALIGPITESDMADDVIGMFDQLRPGGLLDNIAAQIELNTAQINTERLEKFDMASLLFDVQAAIFDFRGRYEHRMLSGERLINAVVTVDPDTGQIVNRAESYADDKFTGVGLLIDGVAGQVDIQAQQISHANEKLIAAESQLTVQAGQITQRATHTEVNGIVASAIAALIPAYSWQFNSDAEGFVGATAWDPVGFVTLTNGTPAVSPALDYDAAENTALRIYVRKHANGVWTGQITFNGGSDVIPVPEPSTENVWEQIQVDGSGTTNYTGSITELSFDLGDCDVDYIVVGKPNANDLALQGLTSRTTTIESDIDAGTGRMTQYATTVWVNDLGYQTQSNVIAAIDSFNTTYSISATLQQFNDNETLTKANTAQAWIAGADAYIRDAVVAYNAEDGSIDNRLTIAQSDINGLTGQMSDQITSVSGLELEIEGAGLQGVLDAYNNFVTNTGLSADNLKIAHINERLTAYSTEADAQAEKLLELLAQTNLSKSAIQSISKVITNDRQATAIKIDALRVEAQQGDQKAISVAQQYTRASVGYCLDADGNVTGESDAVVCTNQGFTWVEGPLAEFFRNLQIEKNGQGASFKDITQVFERSDGQLVVRGGQISDVNGHITGHVSTNDGSIGTLKYIADHWQLGTMQDGVYVPVLHYDLTDPDPANAKMIFTGSINLGGYIVESLEDIQAQDGDTVYVDYNYSVNDGPELWHQHFEPGDIYRRERIVTNGTGGQWSGAAKIVPVKGVDYFDGENAPVIITEFSVDGVNGWTPVYDATHVYYRQSNNDGDSWTDAIKFKGESGDKGPHVEVWFKRATTQPSTPTGNTPNGWSDTPPAGSGQLWAAVGNMDKDDNLVGSWSVVKFEGVDGQAAPHVQHEFSVDGANGWTATYNESHVYMRQSNDGGQNWGLAIKIKGETGQTGAHTEVWFKRAPTQPSTPTGNDIANQGWMDTPGDTTGADVLWAATGRFDGDDNLIGSWGVIKFEGVDAPALLTEFSVDGSTGWTATYNSTHQYFRQSSDNGVNWGSAVRFKGEAGQTGAHIELWFKRATTQPATPTGNTPDGWFDDPDSTTGTEPLWAATGRFDGDDNLIGSWSVVKFEGVDAPAITYEFSVDGLTGWMATYNEGHVYMRQSNDGGQNWGGAIRIRGEDGQAGAHTEYWFKRAPTQPLTPTGPTPADEGWTDAPPTGSGLLWAAVGRFDGNGNLAGGWSVLQFEAAPAPVVITEFSVDGATSWTAEYNTTHEYYRQSNDGGASWGPVIKIRGEDGSTGDNGSYVAVLFKRLATKPTTPTGDDITGQGWSAAEPPGTEKLWAAFGQFDGGGQLQGAWIVVSFEGQDGEDSDVPGPIGPRGAGRFEIGTETGVWVDIAAAEATTDGVPVDGDIVTIYKVDAPEIQTTKKFDGFGWSHFMLHVHGDALVEGTVVADTMRAGAIITGTLDAVTGTLDNIMVSNSNSANDAIHATSNTTTSGGVAVGGYNQGAGSAGRFTSMQGVGVQAMGDNIGVQSTATGGSGSYAFYATGTGNGGHTGYGPFTGAHDGLIKKNHPALTPGDIVCDVDLISIDSLSDVICSMAASSKPDQRSARGVIVGRAPLDVNNMPAALGKHPELSRLTTIYDRVVFNALGEGVINVCCEGGNISVGDLITTSSTSGKGMRQQDQSNLRPYTIAQARQNVTFKPGDIKQVAVIYKCG